jgi:hypothetical protein
VLAAVRTRLRPAQRTVRAADVVDLIARKASAEKPGAAAEDSVAADRAVASEPRDTGDRHHDPFQGGHGAAQTGSAKGAVTTASIVEIRLTAARLSVGA